MHNNHEGTENITRQDPVIVNLSEQLHLLRQENRRTRLYLFVVTLLAVVVIGFLLGASKQTWIDAHAQTVTFSPTYQQPMNPAARQQTRQALQSSLTEPQRKELQEFEAQVAWLKQYMQTMDEGDAGAMVALMLHRMAQNMKTMPGMEQQMNNMSANMYALPVIANNLTQINAKMTVIAKSMDDTLGMMPW